MAKAHGNDLQEVINSFDPLEEWEVAQRFWQKVDKGDGSYSHCWYWQAAKNEKDNTGVFSIRKKTYRAIRVAYALVYRNLQWNKQVNHTCNNNDCVNPEHLVQENGTNAILNNRRKRRAGSSEHSLSEWYKEVPLQNAIQHEGQSVRLAASAEGELSAYTG